jgi:hypothetical protein
VLAARTGILIMALPALMFGIAPTAVGAPPNPPTITEPDVDGKTVNPADVHMEATGFSDPDGHEHECSDWEIWSAAPMQPVWETACASGLQKVHTHLGDGTFVNSHAGRTELRWDTDYTLRMRFRDSGGEVGTPSERTFRTSEEGPAGTAGAVPWAVRQPGYEVQLVATGFQLPVNVALVPQPGNKPSDPFLYVSELYGNVKVVTRDGTVGSYVENLLNFEPTGNFPGSGSRA